VSGIIEKDDGSDQRRKALRVRREGDRGGEAEERSGEKAAQQKLWDRQTRLGDSGVEEGFGDFRGLDIVHGILFFNRLGRRLSAAREYWATPGTE
jgi:hypothetical protein